MRRFVLICLLVSPFLRAAAPTKQEPLVDQVRSAIERGVNFLRRLEAGNGNWEAGQLALARAGGQSCLAMLALATTGVPANDPIMQRGLKYVRELNAQWTYVVGLQTMVLAELGDERDREKIQQNVDWLVAARVHSKGKFTGWSYDQRGMADNSNSQYAVLGLFAGRQAGAKIDREVWESIRDFYRTSQSQAARDDGGWVYRPDLGGHTTLTMTMAGISSLEMSSQALNRNQQGLQPDGTATNCGKYEDDDNLHRALEWLRQTSSDGRMRFRFQNEYAFYNCYGIERAGRLTGRRFLAGYDWYREGCQFLVARQQPDDSWQSGGEAGMFPPVVETSFALLFLAKGRAPVLISKWTHGRDEGWNNKHFDAKNLADYASRELFRRQPLGWQVYDAREMSFRNREERSREVANLVQSPILYLNGHRLGSMTDTQKQIIKQYVEEGGFLLAEACCGKAEFANGFRNLMKELFPDNQLKPLGPEHAIWRSHAIIRSDFAKLEGISMGCKTVVVFSPQPLAGYWEENEQAEGRAKDAFRLAGNIIAYATGLEMPNVRLTPGTVTDDQNDKTVPRGVFQIAQLRHEGDWQPAPRAMPNLLRHLRDRHKLDVDLRISELELTSADLFKFKFLYMQGRGRFSASDEAVRNIQMCLKTGGTLLADASCGSVAFDGAFREFAARLFPGTKLEPIPTDDALYSTAISGEKIESVKIRHNDGTSDSRPPALEGIKVDGRWVVIYSKLDLGCALEKHASADCHGHDHDSALRLAGAAALYNLKK